MSRIDIGNLNIEGERLLTNKKPSSELNNANKAPKHKRGELFIQGPIPFSWMAKASKHSGRGATVKVALLIWFSSGLKQHSNVIKLQSKHIKEFGIERNSLYRGILKLEELKLIAVLRKKGAKPIITILSVINEGSNPV